MLTTESKKLKRGPVMYEPEYNLALNAQTKFGGALF